MSLSCALFVGYGLLALRMNSCLTDTYVQELVSAYAIKSMYPGCYATSPMNGTISTRYYRIFQFPIALSSYLIFICSSRLLQRTVYSQSPLFSQHNSGWNPHFPHHSRLHRTRLSRW